MSWIRSTHITFTHKTDVTHHSQHCWQIIPLVFIFYSHNCFSLENIQVFVQLLVIYQNSSRQICQSCWRKLTTYNSHWSRVRLTLQLYSQVLDIYFNPRHTCNPPAHTVAFAQQLKRIPPDGERSAERSERYMKRKNRRRRGDRLQRSVPTFCLLSLQINSKALMQTVREQRPNAFKAVAVSGWWSRAGTGTCVYVLLDKINSKLAPNTGRKMGFEIENGIGHY